MELPSLDGPSLCKGNEKPHFSKLDNNADFKLNDNRNVTAPCLTQKNTDDFLNSKQNSTEENCQRLLASCRKSISNPLPTYLEQSAIDDMRLLYLQPSKLKESTVKEPIFWMNNKLLYAELNNQTTQRNAASKTLSSNRTEHDSLGSNCAMKIERIETPTNDVQADSDLYFQSSDSPQLRESTFIPSSYGDVKTKHTNSDHVTNFVPSTVFESNSTLQKNNYDTKLRLEVVDVDKNLTSICHMSPFGTLESLSKSASFIGLLGLTDKPTAFSSIAQNRMDWAGFSEASSDVSKPGKVKHDENHLNSMSQAIIEEQHQNRPEQNNKADIKSARTQFDLKDRSAYVAENDQDADCHFTHSKKRTNRKNYNQEIQRERNQCGYQCCYEGVLNHKEIISVPKTPKLITTNTNKPPGPITANKDEEKNSADDRKESDVLLDDINAEMSKRTRGILQITQRIPGKQEEIARQSENIDHLQVFHHEASSNIFMEWARSQNSFKNNLHSINSQIAEEWSGVNSCSSSSDKMMEFIDEVNGNDDVANRWRRSADISDGLSQTAIKYSELHKELEEKTGDSLESLFINFKNVATESSMYENVNITMRDNIRPPESSSRRRFNNNVIPRFSHYLPSTAGPPVEATQTEMHLNDFVINSQQQNVNHEENALDTFQPCVSQVGSAKQNFLQSLLHMFRLSTQ